MQKLTFIVNTFKDPQNLLCCLASLKCQWPSDNYQIDIKVADNSLKESDARATREICTLFDNVEYFNTKLTSCYTSAEIIIKRLPSSEQRWFCFASSDGYYVPGFTAIMLETAMRTDADLVYCNCLYDPRLHGRGLYSVLESYPELRWIDKTCFIIKQSVFKGFPEHPQDWRDGQLVENMANEDKKLAKAKGILVVHN